jgi:hypothetical protein
MSVERLGFGVKPRGFATTALGLLIVSGCLLSACADSPTSPDPRIPPTTGPPDLLQDLGWNFGVSLTTCRVEARWGYLYATSRDVTAEAGWESSAPQVARVIGAGQIASALPGDAELRITFRGVTLARHLKVFRGEPPVLVLESSYNTYSSGRVRDGTIPGLSNGIEGATVEVISGHNNGLSGLTDRGGYYYFYPPFICGPITVRASKSGYLDAVASSVACMNGMPSPMMMPR